MTQRGKWNVPQLTSDEREQEAAPSRQLQNSLLIGSSSPECVPGASVRMKRSWQGDTDVRVSVFLLSFSSLWCLSSKNDTGKQAFDLEHLFRTRFLVACLHAHGAVSIPEAGVGAVCCPYAGQYWEQKDFTELLLHWVNTGLWLYCLSKTHQLPLTPNRNPTSLSIFTALTWDPTAHPCSHLPEVTHLQLRVSEPHRMAVPKPNSN